MVGKQSTIWTLTVMITLTFWSVMRHKVIMGVFYFSDDSFLNLKQAYRRFFVLWEWETVQRFFGVERRGLFWSSDIPECNGSVELNG